MEINPPVNKWLNVQFKQLFMAVFFFHCCGVAHVAADTLSIAVASNFRPVLEQLSDAFIDHQRTASSVFDEQDYQITLSSASSGVLYAQILHGAPYQLFFSANTSYPEKLLASGHGVADSLAVYAVGKVVLVSRRDSVTDTDPEAILSHAKRIAIANPRTAPYGVAASELLEHWQIADGAQEKLVVGNNITQAWQFFYSGNADVAIVAESLIVSASGAGQQDFVTVDLSSHLKHPVRQGRIALQPLTELAQQFLIFMGTATAKNIISDGGYSLPVPDKK